MLTYYEKIALHLNESLYTRTVYTMLRWVHPGMVTSQGSPPNIDGCWYYCPLNDLFSQ